MRIKKLSINLFVLFCSIFLMVILVETGSRIIWKKKYNQWLGKQLHGFEYIDFKRSIIIPKPNAKITVEKYRADLVKHGKTIGLKNLETAIEKNLLPDKNII
jgi:hypothetical protein